MKQVNFPEVVARSIALVGDVAGFYNTLEKEGAHNLLPAGRFAAQKHAELMEKWKTGGAETQGRAEMFGLFRTCYDVLNPVQSGLQNLLGKRGPLASKPIKLEVAPDTLLSAIVRAKEEWSYIDAHPQVVFMRH